MEGGGKGGLSPFHLFLPHPNHTSPHHVSRVHLGKGGVAWTGSIFCQATVYPALPEVIPHTQESRLNPFHTE